MDRRWTIAEDPGVMTPDEADQVLRRLVRCCGICRRPGHRRETCPEREPTEMELEAQQARQQRRRLIQQRAEAMQQPERARAARAKLATP